MTALIQGGIHDPFPFGSSAGNLGTIVQYGNNLAHDPWTPASFCADSISWGMGVSGTMYYDKMDESQDSRIMQGGIGGLFRIAPAHLIFKAAYARFSALGVYFEDDIRLSLATSLFRKFTIGTTLYLFRNGIYTPEVVAQNALFLKESIALSLPFVLLSFQSHHPLRAVDRTRTVLPPSLSFGIHTRQHRYGAQGVTITMVDTHNPRFSFAIGQRFQLHPVVAIDAAVGAAPFTLAAGLVFARPKWNASGALNHHPELGWSKSVGMMMVR